MTIGTGPVAGTRSGDGRVLSGMMRDLPRPHRPRSPLILATALAALLVGCAADSGVDPGASDTASVRPARSAGPMEPVPSESAAPVVGEVPADLLERIVEAAAEEAGVEPSALAVARAESVVWNDGSLGCPVPGELYTQALVPGYHVILEVDGTQLDFRATENGTFRLCEDPGPPSGG